MFGILGGSPAVHTDGTGCLLNSPPAGTYHVCTLCERGQQEVRPCAKSTWSIPEIIATPQPVNATGKGSIMEIHSACLTYQSTPS